MLLFLFLTTVIILPMVSLLMRNGAVFDVPAMLASSVGLALFLYLIASRLRTSNVVVAVRVTSALLLICLVIRVVLLMVYDFSGKGFTAEFITHINSTSVRIGFFEYLRELILATIAIGITALISSRLIKRSAGVEGRLSVALFIIAATLIYTGAKSSPEIALVEAYVNYNMPIDDANLASNDAIREMASTILGPLRRAVPIPSDRHMITATAPQPAPNLIMIYLESFNEILTNNTHYLGLTPEISKLKSRFRHFSQIHSSAYLTIEGMANSQCGTLMNMELANNSLITASGRLSALPCLGDILKAAGYWQIYLGGAELDFAGKGPFLAEHGYDELLGWEYWDRLDYEAIGNWGLADTELFDNAFKIISKRHALKTPFNVTLLTLGTHLPGFTYDGCPQYTPDENRKFLNAIHCTDYLLGQFIKRLEKHGLLDDSVLFIQGDHGVFENPDMKRLFDDNVMDRRVFTLVAAPETIDAKLDDVPEDIQGSSIDTVATLLDLLGIQHNAQFILSQSLLSRPPRSNYIVTRRVDYDNGKVIHNRNGECTRSVTDGPVGLPLDPCDKRRVLKTLINLHATYTSSPTVNENQVCDLAAEVKIDSISGGLDLVWGDQNLSTQFYHRGVRLSKVPEHGVFAVLLDKSDNVIRSLYFNPTLEYDLWRLNQLLSASMGAENLLLARTIDPDTLTDDTRELWPDILNDYAIVYGSVNEGDFSADLTIPAQVDPVRFVPGSCGDGAHTIP
ncbi:MAG: hypothetical protein DHS20C01_07540 [marine bacterium B5-7]|nr:MAG: hypothetical protein DHS20C01_07540 [marine bacterium B5-7]